jgi:DNA repair exonuclease SbcCD ATPase subunit
MTTSAYPTATDYSPRIQRLESDLNYLANQCSELDRRYRSLEESVEESDRKHDRLREETTSAIADQDDDIDRLKKNLTALKDGNRWLARRLRASASDHADLDTTDDTVRGLAATAEQGRLAEATLLPPEERSRMERAVTTFKNAERARRDKVTALLDALHGLATILVGDDLDTRVHAAARQSYYTARESVKEQSATLNRVGPSLPQYQAALLLDDEAREVTRAAVGDGTRARTDLRTRQRTRLTTALSAGSVLPMWLEGALGLGPPSDRVEEWIDLVTEVMCYRATYAVTDPASILGPDPSQGDPGVGGFHDLQRRVDAMSRHVLV